MRLFVRVHQKLSHRHRIELISEKISFLINRHFPAAEVIQCLDVGCGDMEIAERVGEADTRTIWSCIDVHALPEQLETDAKWGKYRQFDGEHIPFSSQSMDVVMFCDVLHHAGGRTLPLLQEAGRVGSVVIVKDHFEYSWYSRTVLQLMDILGNWGYGIVIPTRYFSAPGFAALVDTAGLEIVDLKTGMDLYSHLPFMRRLLRPEWHFLAVLKSRDCL
ncbi:MAG: class I SAM-dependent methyltransferase [Nitrospirota bacterium]|nr:class I SAM-dependent methyltransferase [Nitrospirota bacterium]